MNYMALPGLKNRRGIKFDYPKDKTVELVKEAVTDYFGITFEKLSRRCRKKEILYPRQVLIYLLRQNTSMHLSEIGVLFGLDHTTVIHNIQRIKGFVESYDEIRKEIRLIQASI